MSSTSSRPSFDGRLFAISFTGGLLIALILILIGIVLSYLLGDDEDDTSHLTEDDRTMAERVKALRDIFEDLRDGDDPTGAQCVELKRKADELRQDVNSTSGTTRQLILALLNEVDVFIERECL
jgi:hypothetical protein